MCFTQKILYIIIQTKLSSEKLYVEADSLQSLNSRNK